MFNLIFQGVRSFWWSIQYQQAAAQTWANWVGNSAAPWLAGYLDNVGRGNITTIYTGDEQCNNLFCLFTGLFQTGGSFFDGLSNLVSDVLHTVLEPILNTFLNIIWLVLNLMANIVNLILTAGYALIAAHSYRLQLHHHFHRNHPECLEQCDSGRHWRRHLHQLPG